MLPRDAPTDVLNELQLVQDFYGADTPADHQRVMALFAPNARLDLPQMFVAGRDNISAVMFYAKCFVADIDIEPYMVEVAAPGAAGAAGHAHYTATASTAPTSSTTSTDSTSSTCTSAATSRRRRPSGKPPKAPSAGAAAANGTAAAAGTSGGRSRLGRSKQQQQSQQQPLLQQHPLLSSDVQPRSRGGRQQQHHHSDQTTTTDQFDGTAQNQSAQVSSVLWQHTGVVLKAVSSKSCQAYCILWQHMLIVRRAASSSSSVRVVHARLFAQQRHAVRQAGAASGTWRASSSCRSFACKHLLSLWSTRQPAMPQRQTYPFIMLSIHSHMLSRTLTAYGCCPAACLRRCRRACRARTCTQ